MAGARNPWEENYGSNDGQDSGAKPWEQAYQQPEPPKARTLGAVANDTVIEVANAAAGGVSAAANFVKPGNAVSGWIDKNIVKAGEDSQSDVTKAAKKQFRDEVENADGVMGELGAVGKYVVQNPLLSAAQAAGSFVGPGLAVKATGFAGKAAQLGAKGVERAGRAGGVAAGAAMAGGDAAGTAYELSRNAGATEDQAVDAGRQASVIPAIVGGVSGMFGAERLLAGAKGFAGGAASRALKTGASEAAQEGFEEGVTQYEGQRAAMPYDASIDPSKGVAAAAGMGAALGGITGAGTSLLVGRGPQPGGQEPAPDQPPAQPPAPTPGTGPTLALPAPDRGVIQVAGDGTARTPAYQAPGYVGDVEPKAIDPVREQVATAAAQGGALSSAALTAIDTGLSDAMQPAPEQAPPQISLEEADARDRAAYEQFFASHDSDPVVSRYFENDDDIPDFDAASNASEEDFLRALGATDEDIQDAIATTRQPASPQGSAAVDAGAQANEPAGQSQGAGGNQAAAGQGQVAPRLPGNFTGAPTATIGQQGATARPGPGFGLKDALAQIRAKKQQEAANAQATAPEAAPAAQSVPAAGTGAVEAAGVKTGGFDSAAFDNARANTIKASKAAGNKHLDEVPAYVESMRGKQVYYAHDNKVRGVIRTVDNRGNVYIDWADSYSAEKEMASPVKDGKKTVMRSSIGPTDLKDYVVGQPKVPAANVQPTTEGANLVPQASQTQQGSTQSTQAGRPQAGAATATASTVPAGGNRVQAAGLTDGTTTANTGAQAAPATGTQGAAIQGAAWDALDQQLRDVEDRILAAAPSAMGQGGGDIEAAMKSRKVPVTLKAQRTKLKEQIQQSQQIAPAIGPSLFSDPRTGTPVVVSNKATADAMARSKQLSGKVAVRKATPAEMADDRNAFTGYNAGDTKRMGYVLEMLQSQGSQQNQPPTQSQQAQAATEQQTAPVRQSTETAYTLPSGSIGDEWRDGQKRSPEHPDFTPTPRQQLLMDAVAKALDDGAFYNRDVDEHVAKTLGVTKEQRARNSHNVEGGDFGYDVYKARNAVEAQRGNAKSQGIARELNLMAGDVLGTLVFNDGKVTTGVTIKSLNETGLVATIAGKRGAAVIEGEVGVDAIASALDRAKERGKRKDGYAEFVAGRAAVQQSQPAPATHADPGQAPEVATPAVVAQSVQKAARNEDTKPSEMRKWLVGKIDEAIAVAPEVAVDFLSFDVPGDGTFKVQNSQARLQEFRKKVMASPGFKDGGRKQAKPEQNDGAQGGSGGQMAAITNMIEEGDFEAARDYAEAVGVKLEDVKVPRGENAPAWKVFLSTGKVPEQKPVIREWTVTNEQNPNGTWSRVAKLKRTADGAEYEATVTGTLDNTRATYVLTKDGKEYSRMTSGQPFSAAIELAENAMPAANDKPAPSKASDTGWNMAGTGYGGKRYIGRNITLDDGREVVARVYENAGTYEEAEVKVDGVRKFTVTDRDNAQGKADAFIRTLQDGDQAAGSAKSPTRVTPQISGNPEKFIKVAADSVRELRSVDVDRVLTETPVQFRAEVASYIRDQRKDLADEVDDVMADIQPMAAAPAPSIPAGYKPAGEPFYRGGKQIQGYAPFAPGERVTMKESAGQSGVVENLTSPDDAGVFSGAMVKFDNGSTQIVKFDKLDAETKAEPATGTRRDPTKVSMFNPYNDGDIVTIDGQDWTVKQDTPGWYLTTTGNWRGQHPTIRNVKAMADLIREVEQAATASPAAQPEAPKLTPAEAKSLMEWQDLGQKDGVKTHALTFYESQADKDAKRGRMIVAKVTKGDRSASNWMVDGDDKPLAVLGMAKKRAEDAGMARLVADGYVGEAPTTGPKPARITPDVAANMKAGDVVVDEDGKEYRAHAARHGWLEAHPIVDGKAQVNADSRVMFHLDPQTASAYPERSHKAVFLKEEAAEANPLADYNALAQEYGFEVRPDGAIGSDGKFPGPKMKVKGGRLRIESGSGDLLASYAGTSPDGLGKFLESFWYAEKKADGFVEQAAAESDYASTAEQVEAAQELLLPIRQGEMITDDVRQTLESLLKIPSLKGFDQPTARRLLMIAGATKAAIEKVMRTSPVSIDDLATELGKATGEAEKKKAFDRAFNAASQVAQTDQKVKELLDIYNLEKSILDGIASERGLYGVKWAERNVSSRWTGQSQKVRSVKQRLVDAVNKAAPSVDSINVKTGRSAAETGLGVANGPVYAQRRGQDAPSYETQAVQSGIEGKSLIQAAQFVASTGSPAQREIAKRVVQKLMALQSAGVTLDLKIAHRGDMVPAGLINSRGYTETGFDDKGRDIVVWLNGADVTSKVGTDYETLLHELVHAATAGAILHGASVKNSVHAKSVADLKAVSSAIERHINDRFRQADAGSVELTEFEKDMRASANNAFRNMDEVVAWALSSSEAQQYLESIPYQGGSMWTRFVQAVREFLGLSAASDTALSEVLRVAEAIMNPQDANFHATQAFWHKRGIKMAQQQASGSKVLQNVRNERAEPFYSELSRQIEAANINTAPVIGWKAMLKGLQSKGVKADEITWSGIEEWLDLQTGKVSKADVLAYLAANGVQVEETVLGQPDESDIEELLNDELGEGMTREEAIEYLGNDEGATPTKYANYQLPGGQNYREVLLTLPPGPSKIVTFPSGGSYPEPAPVFKSSHWDTPNVLAHIRVNDRVDADGKRVLFVEEVQGDWGQAGAKKEDTGPAKGFRRGFKGDGDIYSVRPSSIGTGNWEVYDTRTGVAEYGMPYRGESAAQQAAAERNSINESLRPPRAPFVTHTDKWLTLALKRIISMAASEGYDKVAFVNGEQSAERYDLSKQIGRVGWTEGGRIGKGEGWLDADDLNGKQVISKTIKKSELADHIGKEAAQRLLDSQPMKPPGEGDARYELSGLDLKVGGEGMKTFYDQIVPNAAKALLKRLGGGQMESVSIASNDEGWAITPPSRTVSGKWMLKSSDYNSKGLQFDTEAEAKAALAEKQKRSEQPSFTITPAMQEKASGGLPLFRRQLGSKVLQNVRRTPAATIRAAITKAYGKLLGQLESKGLVTLTQTEDEAIEAAAQARADKTGQSVERERDRLQASIRGEADELSMSIYSDEAGKIERALDAMGLQVSTEGSRISQSTYVIVESPEYTQTEGESGSVLKIRVSDHRLPGGYQQPDFEVQVGNAHHGVDMADAAGAWFDAVSWVGRRFGVEPKGAAKRQIAAAAEKEAKAKQAAVAAADQQRDRLETSKVRLQAWLQSLPDEALWGNARRGGWVAVLDGKMIGRFDGETATGEGQPWYGGPYPVEAQKNLQPVRESLRASVKNSVADQTQTENFQRWFKDSKVVDAEGKPLVMYHGGRGEISSFDRPTFFSNLKEYAETYEKGAVYEAFLSIHNPLEVDANGAPFDEIEFGDVLVAADDLIAVAMERGHDGLIVRNVYESSIDQYGDEFVAFRPEQIKSATENNGDFDPANPDIRRSADGSIQGFFDPQTGQSFLIADNLTAEAAPGVLMHEVGIHMAADGSMKALFNRAAMMLKLQMGNPFIKAVQARMDAAGETSGEEAAAYIAEAYENDRANAPASVQRWLADLLAAVKAWMFKKGIMGADRLTVADIAAVARANARSMAQGDAMGSGGAADIQFSRPGTTQDKAVMRAIADGKSTRDVLRLIASSSKNPFNRQVARLLLKAGVTPDIVFGHIGKRGADGIHGQYRGKTDTIHIAGSAEYAAERIFLHEAMHAATMRALRKNGLHSIQLRKLFEHVSKQKSLAGFYGIKNVDEFVVEVFTNPDFQQALRNISAPSGTAWDSFVRILRSILGLGNDTHSALSQALNLGVSVVREDMLIRKKGTRMGMRAEGGVDPDAKAAVALQQRVEGMSAQELAQFLASDNTPAQAAIARRVSERLTALQKQGVKFDFKVSHIGAFAPAAMNRARAYTEFEVDDKGQISVTVWAHGADMQGRVGMDKGTLLHELVHAVTGAALQAGRMHPDSAYRQSVGDLRKLHAALVEHIIDRRKRMGDGISEFEKSILEGANNAMQSEDEILAWGLTNPEMQSLLESMPYQGATGWGRFVQTIRNLLGLAPSADTGLSEVLRIADQIMSADPVETSELPNIAKSGMPMYSTQGTARRWGMAEQDGDGHVANFGTDDMARNIGDGLKSITVPNVKRLGKHKLTDWLKMGLQFLGRRQLVDIYGDMLPMAEYNRLAAQMEADKNESGAEADELVTRWAKLPDEAKLADLMHDATLAQIDPAKPYVDGDDKARYMTLQGRFNALSAEAKQVYTDTRDSYQAHHARVRSAIKERIERSEIKGERKAALLKQMDDEFFKAVKGVYFPLARFGQYAVTVKRPDGKVESVSRAETKAEAEALRNNLLTAFPRDKGFTVGRVMLSKDFIADRDAVGRGFMTELYQVLDKQNMDAVQRAELEDTLGQLYLSSLPDLSWAKHGIHRKGTPGFSQDARRAYAQNMFHGSRYLAKLRYSDLMQDELTAMQKHVDDWREVEDFDQNSAQRVVDEMNKRHESLMNPKSNPLSTALTSLGFVFHLGLSPASALVNLSQTALVAYPIMGAKWGFGKASAALLKASQQAAKGKNDITGALNAEERAAYDEAVRAGTIDVTMAHDLAGIAQGEDAGVMWKIRPVMRWASFLFHHAERFNRQVTFVAAYRLAREAGADNKAAFEQATKATYDGHFDYSASNRARIMQGNVAKVLLLFKQYGQNMVYTLSRNAYQSINGTDAEKAEARKVLAGLLTSHAMAAGVLGLPMVTTLLAAASMIGGDDDEPWDAKVALQNLLADTFGQKPAEVLAHGLSRLTPWDISGRVGLDRLIFPDVQEGLEGQRLAESAMAAALGPVAGIGVNMLKGAQHMSEGRYALGLEAMLPSALRGPVKAIRYANEGVQDKSGISILDEVSPAAVAGQALGFSPSQARNAQEGKSAVMAHDRALGERRQELLTKAARATMAKDAEARAEAMKEIERFNQKNPTRRITPLNVLQSVRNRNKRIDQAQDGVYLPRNRRDAMDAGRFAFAGTD